MKFLITLGPTREPIDDVRFITNASSGKMGTALAKAVIDSGNETTIIAGPVSISLPDCKTINVTTANEMRDAVLSELSSGDYDCFISSAAVADFSPAKKDGKIKSGTALTIDLLPTPKIIDSVRAEFPELKIVGFKAEWGTSLDAFDSYRSKKGLDFLVANDIRKNEFGSDDTSVMIFSDKKKEAFLGSKDDVAKAIIARAL